MKNIIKSLNKKCCAVISRCQTARIAVQAKLSEENGNFASDQSILIAIGLAVGAVAITIVIGALQTDLAPAILAKIRSFFA